jgi:FixJ family two-component response regulator
MAKSDAEHSRDAGTKASWKLSAAARLQRTGVAAQLLAEEPRLKIIFTSGYTGNPAASGTQLVEGVNFIRKPFDPEALAEIVRRKMEGPATTV